MMNSNNVPKPGLPCPTCGSFIETPPEMLLAQASFKCPNSNCGLELSLQPIASPEARQAIVDYKRLVDSVNQRRVKK
jgi:hypothetical protein